MNLYHRPLEDRIAGERREWARMGDAELAGEVRRWYAAWKDAEAGGNYRHGDDCYALLRALREFMAACGKLTLYRDTEEAARAARLEMRQREAARLDELRQKCAGPAREG